jgi:hypothetical protein
MPQRPLPKFLHLGIPFHDLGLEPWMDFTRNPEIPDGLPEAILYVHDTLEVARRIAVNTLPHPTAADVIAVSKMLHEYRHTVAPEVEARERDRVKARMAMDAIKCAGPKDD